MDFLSALFPKRCIHCRKAGEYLCSDCFVKFDFSVTLICAVCGRPAISGLTHPVCKGRYDIDGVFASLVYQGMAKKLVYQFKFAPFLTDLRTVIGDFFYEGLIQQEMFMKIPKQNAIFVPIPLSLKKERRRGYNQADILSRDLGKKLGIPSGSLLKRVKEVPTQVGKTQQERRGNIKGVFAIRPGSLNTIKNKTIFVIDDIVTSGATLNEAAKILKRQGAREVWGLALAHGS